MRAYAAVLRADARLASGHAAQLAKRVENQRRFAAYGSRRALRGVGARESLPRAADGPLSGVSVAFVDTSCSHLVEEELEKTRRDLETAYEELQSTVEKLETTNEELQSTNEELETINEELRERTDEALRANVFLTAVLQSLRHNVIVVDPEQRLTASRRSYPSRPG